MNLNKELLNNLLYNTIVITDVHVINLDNSKDRWNTMKTQLQHLDPIPVYRWRATDSRKMTNTQMIHEKIPRNMFPETIKDLHLKQRRKGEIGCYLSHKKLLQYLSTLDVDDNAGHLILEDDVVIDTNTLDIWTKNLPYLSKRDPKWGMFYFGTNGNTKLTNIKNGIGKLETGWGTFAYIVRHSYIKTILKLIDKMTDAIDIMYQDNYKVLHTYALKIHTIHHRNNGKSTIWNADV